MENLKKLIEEEFSKSKSISLSHIYRHIGNLIGRDLAGTIVVAEIAIGSRPIISLADGIDRERTQIIGIDPQPLFQHRIEYRQGTAQQLPLFPYEVDVLLFNNALYYILSQDSRVESFDTRIFYDSNELAIKKLCSEILRVMPNYVIFRDDALHPAYKKYFKTPEEWYESILENLTPKYVDTELGKTLEKLYDGRKLESWLFLAKNFVYLADKLNKTNHSIM